MKTYYITRYALSDGIYEVQGETTEDGKYVSGKWATGYSFFMTLGTDAFEDLMAAEANVRKRILHKRKSFQKQVEKLNKADDAGALLAIKKK